MFLSTDKPTSGRSPQSSPRPDNADEEAAPSAADCCPISVSGPVIAHRGREYHTFLVGDFLQFRRLADGLDKWTLRFAKGNVFSWDQPPPPGTGNFNIVKVFAVFDEVPGEVMYDVLHDPNYRKEWDDAMIKGYNICTLNDNNDIGYYAVKTPTPASNRDFCNQRAWIETTSGEYIILNTSVEHADQPKVKGLVRAFSCISGYFLRPTPTGGCSLTYLTQANPRGWLPSGLMNAMTAKYAPSLMVKLRNAAIKYPDWKAQHSPNIRPWKTPAVPWPESVENLTPQYAMQHNGVRNPASPQASPRTPQTPQFSS